jgi:glucose uptake protein GlcU
MSWGYWGIVIGLTAMVIMLIGCIRLLSLDDNKEEQTSRLHAGESGDRIPDPSAIRRRAA